MESMEETDDTIIQTQWSAFAASQDQQFASIRRQFEQCQLTHGTGSSPPPIIDTSSKGDESCSQ